MNQKYLSGRSSDMEGVEDTVYFEATPENIAAFLIRHQYAQISAIGTIDEKTYLTAQMGFIDVCPDQQYLAQKILPIYSKAQMGIIPALPLKTVSKEQVLEEQCPAPDWNYLRWDGYSDRKYQAILSGESLLELEWYGEKIPLEMQARSYTVTLGNAEGAVYEIENASMTDTIPVELDFVDGSVQVDGMSADYSFDSETRTLTVPLDSIAPATEKTVTFSVTINDAAYGKTVYNTAVMSGDNIPDTEGTDDGVSVGDGKARPNIEKRSDKSSAKVGDKITYTLSLSNSETATVPVENAVVSDVIPAGLTFEYGSVMLDGSTTSNFTYDENTRLLTVNVGSIEPDTSRTVSFVATVNENAYNTTIQNLATLTSDNTEPVQDKDDGVVVADGRTDLSVLKTVDKSSAKVGDTLTYTVEVRQNSDVPPVSQETGGFYTKNDKNEEGD